MSCWVSVTARVGVLGSLCPCRLPCQINLLIFMRILKVILAKLRANQKGYADYKLRWAGRGAGTVRDNGMAPPAHPLPLPPLSSTLHILKPPPRD